ncbi:hypothetical protein YQE_00753, partial [Dendroctonus ponderosae]
MFQPAGAPPHNAKIATSYSTNELLEIHIGYKDRILWPELALHDDEGHNWWSIIFSLLVIGLVISGIIAAIFLVGYVDELLYWHGERMKLEQYLQGELTPKRLPSSWISSSHFVFQADDGSLAILDTDKNFTVSVLVTNHTLVASVYD